MKINANPEPPQFRQILGQAKLPFAIELFAMPLIENAAGDLLQLFGIKRLTFDGTDFATDAQQRRHICDQMDVAGF